MTPDETADAIRANVITRAWDIISMHGSIDPDINESVQIIRSADSKEHDLFIAGVWAGHQATMLELLDRKLINPERLT